MFSGKILYSHGRSPYLETSETSTGEFSHFWCEVDNDDDHGPAENDDDDK